MTIMVTLSKGLVLTNVGIRVLSLPIKVFSLLDRFAAAIARERGIRLEDKSASKDNGSPSETVNFLIELSTGLWRLRQKMIDPKTGEPLEEMRRAWRHVEALWDLLKHTGIEIEDYENEPYHSGMSLHVIAFQPTEGITRETIIETIRPTVYLKNAMIQPGEVVVASPKS